MVEKRELNVSAKNASLGILIAMLDPKRVVELDWSNKLPEGLFIAERLLAKIESHLMGGAKEEDYPENEFWFRKIEPIFRHAPTLLEWGLIEECTVEGRRAYVLPEKRFTLKEALGQRWCQYERLGRLRQFLERAGFPFVFRGIAPRSAPSAGIRNRSGLGKGSGSRTAADAR